MTKLETDLRDALHDHAARVHASPALLATDYHPRTRWTRPRIAVGGGLATTAGALAAVLTLAGGASNAFAGWTARPQAPTRAQRAATDAYCASNIPDSGLPLQLMDARGPFTIAVYSDGTSNDFCTDGPSFQNASGWSTSPPVSVPAGQLYLWDDHTATDNGQPYGIMIAEAASDVTAANITLTDGTQVMATVQNGWAVAWWPGPQHVASAQLTTPSGTQTQRFAPYPCDIHNCNGGPHGGAPGGGPGGG
jgi:hypothetical protein